EQVEHPVAAGAVIPRCPGCFRDAAEWQSRPRKIENCQTETTKKEKDYDNNARSTTRESAHPIISEPTTGSLCAAPASVRANARGPRTVLCSVGAGATGHRGLQPMFHTPRCPRRHHPGPKPICRRRVHTHPDPGSEGS